MRWMCWRGRFLAVGCAAARATRALPAAFLAVVLAVACEKAKQSPLAVVARAPQASEQTVAAVAALPTLGFFSGIVSHADASLLRAALDAAQRVGVSLFVGDPRLLTADTPLDSAFAHADQLLAHFAAHPACAGYWLGTMADTLLFDRVAAIAQRMAAGDRLHPVLVGLSGYGADGARGPWRFSLRSLERFIATVRPSLLYFDQQGVVDGATAPDFFANLSTIRRVALASRLPWWGVVLEPRPGAETLRDNYVRLQAMSLLAHGAKGLQYVLDWSVLQGWSAPRAPLSPVARGVAEVNATVAAWSPILSHATCTAVYHSAPVPTGGDPLSLEGIVYRVDGEYTTVALFRGKRKKDLYVMVVNRNYSRGAKPRLYFGGQVKGLEEVAPPEAARLIRHFAPRESPRAVPVLLKAGGGRLFRLVT